MVAIQMVNADFLHKCPQSVRDKGVKLDYRNALQTLKPLVCLLTKTIMEMELSLRTTYAVTIMAHHHYYPYSIIS
ncbi:MAG TPA: hypothetical protein VLX91_05805 [Candidatus Acidoferrales bacterium]|nr:hypothetical protein [Candidatus Acidoferrales bacterium]